MKAERRSAMTVLTAVMLAAPAGHAVTSACGMRLLSPASRIGAANPAPGELLTAIC